MRNYLLPIFALLIVGCGNQRPRQTYDEMLNDIVQNFNTGTTGGDSVLNAFVRKTQADSVARQYSNPAIKEEMMFNLISDYLVAGQVDNAQHLYDNMLEYAESEYGKVCQMKATVYFEKAHLYEQTGDLDNAIKMMQKSAEVFEKLPKNECNQYNDAKEFIKRWTSDNPIIEFKDPKFLEALLSNYGLDRNGDGQISKREAANVKYLHIDKYAITSMGEICYFTALKKLYCYNNQLTSLDLSKNSELTYLNCRYNQLTSLDISKKYSVDIFILRHQPTHIIGFKHEHCIDGIELFQQSTFLIKCKQKYNVDRVELLQQSTDLIRRKQKQGIDEVRVWI